LSDYSLWACPFTFLSGLSLWHVLLSKVPWVGIPSPSTLFMSYVYPLESPSLSIFMLKGLCFLVICLKSSFLWQEEWCFLLPDVFTSCNYIVTNLVCWFWK
jgi:hypothetical protein